MAYSPEKKMTTEAASLSKYLFFPFNNSHFVLSFSLTKSIQERLCVVQCKVPLGKQRVIERERYKILIVFLDAFYGGATDLG